MRLGPPGAVCQLWAAERDDMLVVHLYIAKNIVGPKRSLTGFVQAPDKLTRLRGLRFNQALLNQASA